MENNIEFTLSGEKLNVLFNCTSTDKSQYTLNGIGIFKNGNIVAIDGRRLFKINLNRQLEMDKDHIILEIKNIKFKNKHEYKIKIQNESVSVIEYKILKNTDKIETGIVFNNGSIINAKFPNYEMFIPKDYNKINSLDDNRIKINFNLLPKDLYGTFHITNNTSPIVIDNIHYKMRESWEDCLLVIMLMKID